MARSYAAWRGKRDRPSMFYRVAAPVCDTAYVCLPSWRAFSPLAAPALGSHYSYVPTTGSYVEPRQRSLILLFPASYFMPLTHDHCVIVLIVRRHLACLSHGSTIYLTCYISIYHYIPPCMPSAAPHSCLHTRTSCVIRLPLLLPAGVPPLAPSYIYHYSSSGLRALYICLP